MSSTGGYFLLAGSLAVGVSLASQAGVNSQLRLALQSPVQAAFISFLIGTCILGTICLVQGFKWFESGLSVVPWWAWVGGFLGAFNIAMSIYLAPKLGALTLAVSIVSGQVIASMVFDKYGLLGYPKIELSTERVVGALLIIVGLLLASRR